MGQALARGQRKGFFSDRESKWDGRVVDGTVIRESSPEATLLSWGTLKVHCGLAQVGWGEIKGLGQGEP